MRFIKFIQSFFQSIKTNKPHPVSGMLNFDGSPAGYDWSYLNGRFNKKISSLKTQNKPVRIQARFVWQGDGNENGHAETGYFQLSSPNFPDPNAGTKNSSTQPDAPQKLWNYGASVLVTPVGIALETFRVPEHMTIVWDQQTLNGQYVQKEGSPEQPLKLVELADVLDDTSSSYYISAYPQASLERGCAYWVRATLVNSGNECIRLTGELFVNTTLVQKASIEFPFNTVFPNNEDLHGAVGRTPHNHEAPLENASIQFDAYDHF